MNLAAIGVGALVGAGLLGGATLSMRHEVKAAASRVDASAQG